MNENKANFAKIGFFVLAGFVGILIAIGIAGARVFTKKMLLTETYFTESVAGLDIGSPVKYRGVPVGEVHRIGFVFSEYGKQASGETSLNGANQILVVMALDPEKFTPLKGGDPTKLINRCVKDGMRVKLAAAGVTGLSFLELDYVRSDQFSEMSNPLAWQPKNPYIPSFPSTMFTFKKAMDDVFVKLSQADIKGLVDKVISTLALVQEKLKRTEIEKLTSEATALLSELRQTNKDIQRIAASPELANLPADIGATAGSARRITATVEAQIGPITKSIQSVSKRADQLAETLSGIASNSSGQVEQTVEALNHTAQTLNRTTLSQQDAVAELIENLRDASSELKSIVSDLHANPAALLFSTPPPPLPETDPAPAKKTP